ncbi:ABC transporter substrate-binding protein [Paenibacillus harenae]|uniref:ABC transporter substrate-binding protein n=1 Tax=Paenibacillus harenae TaxID=306543 RepID=UPI00041F0BC7|nr:ABC transporter substrate-binding protein [Paenibacillus harenae]
MKFTKKILSIAITACLIVAAGCSAGTESVNNEQGSTNGANNGQSSKNTTEKVKLEFLSNKADVAETMDKIIKGFQEQNPNIVIEQNTPPNMLKVLTMRFSTNDAPPVFTVYPSAPSFAQLLKDDNVAELTGDPVLENVEPSFVEFSQNNGKNYAVPYALEGYGVVYNADLFKELNLGIPQTYNELIQVAEKIKAAGKTPFVFADKEHSDLRRISAALLGLDMTDAVPFFQDVINGKKHIADRETEIRRFAEKTLELRKYAQKDLLGMSGDNAVVEVANGKAAMYFMGMWKALAVKKANPSMNVAMFAFPAEKAEDTKVAMQVGTALAMPKDIKTPDEVKKFMAYFATTENAQLYSDETGQISVIKGVTHKVKENIGLAEMALAGKMYRAADATWTPAMQEDFGKATQELLGGASLEAYLKKLEEIFYNKAS